MARPGGNESEPNIQGPPLLDDLGSQDGRPTDDYMMTYYKVVPCSRRYAHDWASCPCKHVGERAARRNLGQHPHLPIACHYAKQCENCPLGDRCTHAHNMFEYWLHPQRFKTELCQFGAKCIRSVCFYAHSMSDLKPLDPSLPPPEACWSSGAMLNRGNRYQQRQAQAQGQGQHPTGGGLLPSTSTGCPGQSASDWAGMQVPPGMVPTPQQSPQPQQVIVVNTLPACGTPRTPNFNPAVHPAQYVQQLPAAAAAAATAAGGAAADRAGHKRQCCGWLYATVTLPVSNAGLPVVSVGGVQGAVVLQAQQAPQPQPQQVLQYSMPGNTQQVLQCNKPGSNQQVLQCNMPGSSQPTHWVQVPDPTVVNSASAAMAAGQVLQIELPAATIAPAGISSLPAQAFVLDGGYVLQQQQQPVQGVISLQALSAPPPAGLVQVGVLDSAGPGLVSAGGSLTVAQELQQRPSSTGSWQCMYPPSTHSMLMDLQNMGFG